MRLIENLLIAPINIKKKWNSTLLLNSMLLMAPHILPENIPIEIFFCRVKFLHLFSEVRGMKNCNIYLCGFKKIGGE